MDAFSDEGPEFAVQGYKVETVFNPNTIQRDESLSEEDSVEEQDHEDAPVLFTLTGKQSKCLIC